MAQVENTLPVQPKSTAFYSLAREIPAHRQEKLAGRQRVGPIRNIAPFWSNINAPIELSVGAQAPVVYPKSVTLDLPDDPISQEIRQLKNRLLEKEKQLEQSEQARTESRTQFSRLVTAKNTAEAVAKNLRQQMTNIMIGPKDTHQLSDLQSNLQGKERELTDLKQELQKLKEKLEGKQEPLRREIELYRRQIRELSGEQKQLHLRVSNGDQVRADDRAFPTQDVREDVEPKYQQMLEKAMETPLAAQAPRPQKIKPASVARDTGRTPALTGEKNAINGVIKDSLGKQVSNAIIIIKDKSGHSLRALKSNQLGQFAMTTPLPNGEYLIEVEKKGLTFDLTSIYLTGEKVPLIEITSNEHLT